MASPQKYGDTIMNDASALLQGASGADGHFGPRPLDKPLNRGAAAPGRKQPRKEVWFVFFRIEIIIVCFYEYLAAKQARSVSRGRADRKRRLSN
jgi:hypothetical protein